MLLVSVSILYIYKYIVKLSFKKRKFSPYVPKESGTGLTSKMACSRGEHETAEPSFSFSLALLVLFGLCWRNRDFPLGL